MKANNQIDILAKQLSDSCVENAITEKEIKQALIHTGIYSHANMADIMDALEAMSIKIIPTLEALDFEDEDEKNINIVKHYFNDISKIPLLKKEEEETLIVKAKEGNKEAKDKLVNANQRLVVWIAKRYYYAAELLDLISAGNIGLIIAIEKFKPSIGTKFGTYATWWIKNAITEMITNECGTIRIPKYMLDKRKDINNFILQYKANNSKEPTIQELSDKFDIDKKTISSFLNATSVFDSLDKSVNTDGNTITTIGDMIADKDTDLEEDIMLRIRHNDILEVLRNVLTEKESDIIIRHFGLEDNEQESFEKIGKDFRRSKERIRQIEEKALAKLRNSSEAFERLHQWND